MPTILFNEFLKMLVVIGMALGATILFTLCFFAKLINLSDNKRHKNPMGTSSEPTFWVERVGQKNLDIWESGSCVALTNTIRNLAGCVRGPRLQEVQVTTQQSYPSRHNGPEILLRGGGTRASYNNIRVSHPLMRCSRLPNCSWNDYLRHHSIDDCRMGSGVLAWLMRSNTRDARKDSGFPGEFTMVSTPTSIIHSVIEGDARTIVCWFLTQIRYRILDNERYRYGDGH